MLGPSRLSPPKFEQTLKGLEVHLKDVGSNPAEAHKSPSSHERSFYDCTPSKSDISNSI